MAFRTDISLSEAFLEAKTQARTLKSTLEDKISTMASITVGADYVWGIQTLLEKKADRFNSLSSIPGIGAYAQAQYNNDTGYDVGAEFIAMLNAIGESVEGSPTAGALGVIQELVPKCDNDTFLAVFLATWEWRQFTPAQTVALRNALQSVVDTIS